MRTKRREHFKKRRFKPTSKRRLSLRDLAVFEFLWLWKVATTAMLSEVAFKGKSPWWIYKALKQLEREKYIQRLPRGRNIEQELWTLTENGFEVFLMDRDDIKYYRFRVHAPSHDFLGTCLQLGDYWLDEVNRTFFTEQMLSSLAPSNFPRELREVTEHVPDGVTLFNGAIKSSYICYEVDLNLKDEERYKFTQKYYNRVAPTLVIWLVKNQWMATKIREACLKLYDNVTNEIQKRFVFILLDDFKKNVWGAKSIDGQYEGRTVSNLHATLMQNLGKPLPKTPQKDVHKLFFQKFKSPQKLSV